MSFIEVVICGLIIAVFVVVYYDLKDTFRKGGDFTMINPPKPPVKEKSNGDLTIDVMSGYKDEITRLNNRVEGLSKENIQLRNSKLMLRRQNKAYKNEISKLTSNMNEFKNERNEYRREVERLKKELESVI